VAAVGGTGDLRNTYDVLLGKPERNRILGIPRLV
jgi:hypothetical protein